MVIAVVTDKSFDEFSAICHNIVQNRIVLDFDAPTRDIDLKF